MLDVNKIREDFPLLKKKMQGHDLVYFDSAATSLKPKEVIEAMDNYYFNIGSNVHRGDYDLSALADKEFENARKKVASFINAKDNEIIFTSGTTASLNLCAFGYVLENLNDNDEIILNEAEHASNILPFFEIAKRKNIKIVYAPLDDEYKVTLENIKKVINERTKIISIAYITNVLGSKNEIEKIIKYAHSLGIIVIVDGAQAIPHLKIDVKDLDIDFLAFSSHKMLGPTGIGVLYGKYELLNKMSGLAYGGGMNNKIFKDHALYKNPPFIFEGGTPPIAEVIGLSAAIDYLNKIGMDNIHAYEKELKAYAVSKLEKLDNVKLYNATSEGANLVFNIKGVFCQDMGSFFNYKGIALRTGHHCAKLLPININELGSIRASLYFYNTKEEIDYFVDVCAHGGEYLDAIFN